MRPSRLLPLSLLLAAPLLPSPARACGGLVQPANGTLGLDAQRAFFSVKNGATDVIVQIQVPSAGVPYGVLLPAPVQPTLDATPVDSKDLDALEAATRPTIRASVSEGGGGFGCGAKAADAGGAPQTPRVIIGQQVDIGPVTAVSLSADSGVALTSWLGDNGFALPAAAQRVVDGYAGPGRWFVALRRRDTPPAGASSIGVHFSLGGDQRGYALRMAGVGAGPSVAITAFVAAPQPAGAAAPFRTLTLLDLPRAPLQEGDYRGAIRQAVTAAGATAFVAEGVYEASAVLPPRLLSLSSPGHQVTRLSAVLTPAELTQDVRFDGPAPASIPTSVVAAASKRGRDAGALASLLGLSAFALVLRRRR